MSAFVAAPVLPGSSPASIARTRVNGASRACDAGVGSDRLARCRGKFQPPKRSPFLGVALRPEARFEHAARGGGAGPAGRPRASVEEEWERLKELYDFKEPARPRAASPARAKYGPQDLQELGKRDYTLVVDKSASMGSPVAPGRSQSRWEAMREAALALAQEAARFDPDGLTLYLFSGKFNRFDNVTPSEVERVFEATSPSGSTDLAAVLLHAADDYFARRDRGRAKANGELLIVATDGEPDSKEDVYRAIVSIANRCRRAQELRITFIQVGNDRRARAFLKELDDEMERRGAMFDVVDTKDPDEMEGLSLRQVLLEALFD